MASTARAVAPGRNRQRELHAALKTIAAFLNTEGGDLLIGVDDDRRVLGIAHDRLENDDTFMLHLAQAVRNGLGDRAGTQAAQSETLRRQVERLSGQMTRLARDYRTLAERSRGRWI